MTTTMLRSAAAGEAMKGGKSALFSRFQEQKGPILFSNGKKSYEIIHLGDEKKITIESLRKTAATIYHRHQKAEKEFSLHLSTF